MKEAEFIRWLSDYDYLRVRFKQERGRILEFAVQLESWIRGAWRPIVRYDTAHGFAHRDELRPQGPATKTDLRVEDWNEALTFAERELARNWRHYRERYERWLTERN